VVYVVAMPAEVKALLNLLTPFFSLSIDSFGLPLQCLNLQSFYNKLLFMMSMPVIISVGIAAACVIASVFSAHRARKAGGGGGALGKRDETGAKREAWWREPCRAGFFTALPLILAISFLVFPMVSSLAFQAFDCENFDEGLAYLKADYAVDCNDTSEYGPVSLLAWVAVALYPLGIPAAYWVMLQKAKRAILEERPTALSNALAFLHRDFEPSAYYWEIVEGFKKLFLVGFAMIIMKDKLEQLAVALIFILIYMLLMAVKQPYRQLDNDYYALACNFGLTVTFFMTIVLKVTKLTDAVDAVLTDTLRFRYEFSLVLLTAILFAAIVGALALMGLLAANQLVAAANVPTLHVTETKSEPDLVLEKGQKWHVFLSHSARAFYCPTPHLRRLPWSRLTCRASCALWQSGVQAKTSARRSSGSCCSLYPVSRSSSTSTICRT